MAANAEHPSGQAAAIPESFALYGNILDAYNSMGLLPLKWTHGRMEVVKSNRVWFATKITLVWLHIAFLDVQWTRSLFTEGETSHKMLFTLQAVAYSATAVNFLVLIHYPQLIASMMNNLLELQQRHGEFAMKGKETAARRVIKISLFVCAFAPFSFAIRVLRKPEHPRSLVSLTSNPAGVAVQWKVACCIYQLYSLCAASATLWMVVSTVTVSLRSLTRIITVTNKLGNEILIKEINEINLLLNWFNCTFRHWTVVWEATFISLVVIDLNVAIKQQSIQPLLVAGSMAKMMIYLYTNMGEIYEKSKDIMDNALPRARDAPWFKRKRRAYRAFRVNVGSFYFVDKGLVLTILSITIQCTANILLTLRKA